MSCAGVGSQMESGAARWQPSPLPQVSTAHLKESGVMLSAFIKSMRAPRTFCGKAFTMPPKSLPEDTHCHNSLATVRNLV